MNVFITIYDRNLWKREQSELYQVISFIHIKTIITWMNDITIENKITAQLDDVF